MREKYQIYWEKLKQNGQKSDISDLIRKLAQTKIEKKNNVTHLSLAEE